MYAKKGCRVVNYFEIHMSKIRAQHSNEILNTHSTPDNLQYSKVINNPIDTYICRYMYLFEGMQMTSYYQTKNLPYMIVHQMDIT